MLTLRARRVLQIGVLSRCAALITPIQRAEISTQRSRRHNQYSDRWECWVMVAGICRPFTRRDQTCAYGTGPTNQNPFGRSRPDRYSGVLNFHNTSETALRSVRDRVQFLSRDCVQTSKRSLLPSREKKSTPSREGLEQKPGDGK